MASLIPHHIGVKHNLFKVSNVFGYFFSHGNLSQNCINYVEMVCSVIIQVAVLICFFQAELANYLYESLSSVPGVRIYGPAPSETVRRAALCSFNVEDIQATDIATILDQVHKHN